MTMLKTRMKTSLALKSQAHNQASILKLGLLRGGSAGIVLSSGDSLGKCPRISHLRQIGVEEEVDLSSKILFEAGYSNETVVKALLDASTEPGEEWTSAEDVRFTLPSGLEVGLRPDLLLTRGGQAQLGVELKNIASLWTARDVHYDLKPKSEHLIQAGLYSLAYGKLPWRLLYSSYGQFHLSTAPKWLQDKFKPGAPDVEFTDRGPLKITSFFREYELTWQEGFLCYQTEGLDKPVLTDVSLEGFDKYYQRVQDVQSKGVLPKRPTPLSVDGSKSYNPCDYCRLKPACDAREKDGYENWLDAVIVTPGFDFLKA